MPALDTSNTYAAGLAPSTPKALAKIPGRAHFVPIAGTERAPNRAERRGHDKTRSRAWRISGHDAPR